MKSDDSLPNAPLLILRINDTNDLYLHLFGSILLLTVDLITNKETENALNVLGIDELVITRCDWFLYWHFSVLCTTWMLWPTAWSISPTRLLYERALMGHHIIAKNRPEFIFFSISIQNIDNISQINVQHFMSIVLGLQKLRKIELVQTCAIVLIIYNFFFCKCFVACFNGIGKIEMKKIPSKKVNFLLFFS